MKNGMQDIAPLKKDYRVKPLDGLRGLAIILVVLYHAYSRWSGTLPWIAKYQNVSLFKYGYLGVQLFFLISGFVIHLTLDKCGSFNEFIFRRWIRLFPAMFACSILIFVTAVLLPERPLGIPNLIDVLPGLLFVEPRLLHKIFSMPVNSLDGAFWSLFVEVKFYIVFGMLYYLSRTKALYCLTAIFLAGFLCDLMETHGYSAVFKPLGLIFSGLSVSSFGWFIIGALLYKIYSGKGVLHYLGAGVLLVPTIIWQSGGDMRIVFVCFILFLLFVLALFHKKVGDYFMNPVLLFVGFISYPLYLIHQNASVSLTVKIHENFAFVPDFFTPYPGLAALVLIAYIVARYLEPLLKKLILSNIALLKSGISVYFGR